MPKFSLVLPTLRRADTLRHALATVVAQDFADAEIVVQNNGADPDVERVVRGFDDARIRLHATPTVVPMSANWESALDNTRGDYVTFIGDDDGLFPDACALARDAIDATGTEIVSWLPFLYYWPEFANAGRRNRIVATVDYDFRMTVIDSLDALRQVYRWRLDYSGLPMIYNSFVSRRVLERARARTGRYFIGASPDVVSGIVNAAASDGFVRLTRPLSMSGISQHSTGHNNFFHRIAAPREPGFMRDFGQLQLDPRLVGETSLQAIIAQDLLAVQREIFPEDGGVTFDFTAFVGAMASAINETAGSYDKVLAAARAIAAHNGVDLGAIPIPARMDQPPVLQAGAAATGRHSVRYVIDGDAAGLATIVDAIRLMHAVIPRADALDRVAVAGPAWAAGAELPPGGVLTFGADGNGLAALGDGWSEPEAWGTWSAAPSCALRIAVPKRPNAPCTLELACRPFLHGPHNRLGVACRTGERPLARWVLDDGPETRRLPIDVPADAWSAKGTLALEFELTRPCSPAQLGISNDTRLLGIGLEWMRIAEHRPD